MNYIVRLAILIGCSFHARAAQDAAPATGNVGNSEFPKISADLRVTFRLKAPKAGKVQLQGGAGLAKTPIDLVRSDDGVWTVTTQPDSTKRSSCSGWVPALPKPRFIKIRRP